MLNRSQHIGQAGLVYTPGTALERVAWRALELMPRKTRAAWTPLAIVRAQVDGVSQLTVQPDGTVLAGGPQDEAETFVVDAAVELPQITALRLEALADPTLPAGGPGRSNHGSFFGPLRGFELTVFDSERRVIPCREGPPDPLPVLEISQADERDPAGRRGRVGLSRVGRRPPRDVAGFHHARLVDR